MTSGNPMWSTILNPFALSKRSAEANIKQHNRYSWIEWDVKRNMDRQEFRKILAGRLPTRWNTKCESYDIWL
jgi:hypothetical protein